MLYQLRVCIKFCVKLGKSATESLEMLPETFGEHSLRWTAVFAWYSRFRANQVSVEEDRCTGHPGTSKNGRKCWKNSRTHQQSLSLNNP
jgi:hypothetical protein